MLLTVTLGLIPGSGVMINKTPTGQDFTDVIRKEGYVIYTKLVRMVKGGQYLLLVRMDSGPCSWLHCPNLTPCFGR